MSSASSSARNSAEPLRMAVLRAWGEAAVGLVDVLEPGA